MWGLIGEGEMIIPSARVDLLYDSLEVLIGSLTFSVLIDQEQCEIIRKEIYEKAKKVDEPITKVDLIGLWKLRNGSFAKVDIYHTEIEKFGGVFLENNTKTISLWDLQGNNIYSASVDLMKRCRGGEDTSEKWPTI